MFQKTLDNKPLIIDNKGNEIVDLATSIFNENAGLPNSYSIRKMSSYYQMRPDLVANAEYGTTEGTEYVLKYSGISNPFSLSDDDILMIPNYDEADNKTQSIKNTLADDNKVKETQIRNFYKFVNTDYKENKDSYKALKQMEIPSAVQKTLEPGDYYVPYISEDGNTAITIRNGRMYFGTDSGFSVTDVIKASTTNMDEKIQAVIDSTATALSDSNCMYNGVSLANFVRASIIDNFASKDKNNLYASNN